MTTPQCTPQGAARDDSESFYQADRLLDKLAKALVITIAGLLGCAAPSDRERGDQDPTTIELRENADRYSVLRGKLQILIEQFNARKAELNEVNNSSHNTALDNLATAVQQALDANETSDDLPVDQMVANLNTALEAAVSGYVSSGAAFENGVDGVAAWNNYSASASTLGQKISLARRAMQLLRNGRDVTALSSADRNLHRALERKFEGYHVELAEVQAEAGNDSDFLGDAASTLLGREAAKRRLRDRANAAGQNPNDTAAQNLITTTRREVEED